MKKMCTLSLVLGFLMMIPVMANAQALVIKDTACTLLDADLQPFDTFNSTKIITPSRMFNKNVSAHGDLPEGTQPPPNAVVLDYENTGISCCVNFDGTWYSTTQWHETITPSGNVSLTCHFKGDEQAGQCGGSIPE